MITVEEIFKLVFWVYWGGALLVLGVAYMALRYWLPQGKRRWVLLWSAVFSGLVFVLPVALAAYQEQQRKQARRARYQAAKAVFDERCKHAGEKIYRTAKNVEGVMLMKVIPRSTDADWRNPMWPDAAKAEDFSGDNYLASFLHYFNVNIIKGEAYQYVDVLNNDQSITRYRGDWHPSDQAFTAELNPAHPARYAVDYANDVNPQDRQHWVAGTTIRVIDRETNEVMAEKVIYAFDKGLGSLGTGRSPWLLATTCPYEYDYERHTVLFVNKVLHPLTGENHE